MRKIFKQIKRGYTIAEIMLCLGAMTLVIAGAFTLYGKVTNSFVEQSDKNNYVYTESSVFLELNDMFLNGYEVTYSDGKVYIDDDIISVIDNNLCRNGKQLITNDSGVKLEVIDERVFISIGGNEWCFTSINGVT